MDGTLALCPSYAIKATSLACKGTETALFLVGSKSTQRQNWKWPSTALNLNFNQQLSLSRANKILNALRDVVYDSAATSFIV